MSENDEAGEQQATAEKEARTMGWSPKENWKGDPEKWVDADVFVKRGNEIMPILRENNKRLQHDLAEVKGELAGVKMLLANSQDAIEALKEFNSTSTLNEARRTKDDIKEAIKKAKTDGDLDTEIMLTDQLSEVNTVIKSAEKEDKEKKEVKKPKGEEEKPVDYTKDPIFVEWQERNSWWGSDKRRTRLADTIAREMRLDPETKDLMGKAFLDRLTEEVDATVGEPAESTRSSKVEGSRGGRGKGGGDGGGKGYIDLPADAKAACERQAARLVGEGRAYKSDEDWRKAYARKYYEEENAA